MRMLSLAAGVAALALAAPVASKPDRGGGGGGGGKPAKIERGGGGQKAARAERRGGGEQRARAERRGGKQQARAERRPERVERRARLEDRVRPADRREARAERRQNRERIRAARGNDRVREVRRRDEQLRERRNDRVREARVRENRAERIREARQRDNRLERVRDRLREDRFDRRRDDGLRFVSRDRDRRDGYSFRYADYDRRDLNGCPPGLAAKNNGCLPPGQAKKLVGRALPAAFAASLLPGAYRNWYPDNDDYYYREGDGLIYRISRNSDRIDGYSPLWGYGVDYVPDYYYVGERYPLDYVSFYNVPEPYQPYYRDDDDWLYRYGDGGIYQVNRSSGVVEAIVALLGGDLAVGQPLPVGYDVYNVPYSYRDRYYDTDDNWYRYSDGYIYQVDPKTRLIQAVIQALV